MRKYDNRVNNGATRQRRRANSNLGRKPKWMKHLSRNSAYDILQEFDAIASPAEIYRYCWENKLMQLVVGMREYVWNRLEGRPFVAENPNAGKKPNPVVNDNRLQIAIQTLLPSTATSGAHKLPRTRRKALPAAVTLEAKPDVQAEPTEQSDGDWPRGAHN
jgi:hypothetical protein